MMLTDFSMLKLFSRVRLATPVPSRRRPPSLAPARRRPLRPVAALELLARPAPAWIVAADLLGLVDAALLHVREGLELLLLGAGITVADAGTASRRCHRQRARRRTPARVRHAAAARGRARG